MLLIFDKLEDVLDEIKRSERIGRNYTLKRIEKPAWLGGFVTEWEMEIEDDVYDEADV